MSYEARNSALTATALAYNPQAPLDPKKGTFLGDIPPVPRPLVRVSVKSGCQRKRQPIF